MALKFKPKKCDTCGEEVVPELSPLEPVPHQYWLVAT